MYELPCKCKGSVGVMHMSCFVRTMLHRAEVGQGSTCDVCHVRIPTPARMDVLHYHCLCYNMSFVGLLYLLFATVCCFWWMQEFEALSSQDRRRSFFQFGAVVLCLLPTLWLFMYIFVSLHVIVHAQPGHTDLTMFYRDYLASHGKVVNTV